MLIQPCHRAARTATLAVLFLAVATACSGAEPRQRAAEATRPVTQQLETALLTGDDVSGFTRRAAQAGSLTSLGYQEMFDQLRKLDADKPQCLRGYLGGISGPVFQRLHDAPAAMAVFRGSQSSFGQVIVALPEKHSGPVLSQSFPPECATIKATLPDGGMTTISLREIRVAPLGERVRAFRGRVVVAGKDSVMLSETIRAGGYVHNIQLQGGDRRTLQRLAEQAVDKAGRNLA